MSRWELLFGKDMNAVIKAKKKFKKLYHISFDDDTAAVFKGINWGTFKKYRALLSSLPNMEPDIIEDVFRDCIIELHTPGIYYKRWATEADFEKGYMNLDDVLEYIPAGLAITIVDYIFGISGAMSADQFFMDLHNRRDYSALNVEARITSLLSSVFKTTNKDWDKMDWDDALEMIAQGELLLGGQAPGVPFNIEKEEKSRIDFDKENKEYWNN